MKAHVGDHLIIKSHRVGEGERSGEILDVKETEGEPSYLVRWDDGHEGWLYPGPDAYIQPKKTKTKKG